MMIRSKLEQANDAELKKLAGDTTAEMLVDFQASQVRAAKERDQMIAKIESRLLEVNQAESAADNSVSFVRGLYDAAAKAQGDCLKSLADERLYYQRELKNLTNCQNWVDDLREYASDLVIKHKTALQKCAFRFLDEEELYRELPKLIQVEFSLNDEIKPTESQVMLMRFYLVADKFGFELREDHFIDGCHVNFKQFIKWVHPRLSDDIQGRTEALREHDEKIVCAMLGLSSMKPSIMVINEEVRVAMRDINPHLFDSSGDLVKPSLPTNYKRAW